jgi:RNA polymerase sigma factor (sigma-70 family)
VHVHGVHEIAKVQKVSQPNWPIAELVDSAKRGDVASIATLVATSHPHVQRFAHTLCSTPEDAEEAAQEALIVLFRRIGTLRATAAFSSWMFRIVRAECIRRSRASFLVLRSGQESIPQTADDDVENDVLCRLEAGRIAEAIAQLPADQRAVLIMRDVQDIPGQAVASSLGLSKAAMKSRLHRARQSVREFLDESPSAQGT